MPYPSDRARARRPGWEAIVERTPREAAAGCAVDEVLADAVREGHRGPVLRLWQSAHRVLLIAPDTASVIEGTHIMRRSTPGEAWLAPGPAAILWSVIARRDVLSLGGAPTEVDAVCEWPLASLRQLGLQASVRDDGAIMTPMGPVGTSATARHGDVLIAQGMIDYAIDAADREATGTLRGETENVRSQSGLPLPLVLDRFTRMARTLYFARASEITPDEEQAASVRR